MRSRMSAPGTAVRFGRAARHRPHQQTLVKTSRRSFHRAGGKAALCRSPFAGRTALKTSFHPSVSDRSMPPLTLYCRPEVRRPSAPRAAGKFMRGRQIVSARKRSLKINSCGGMRASIIEWIGFIFPAILPAIKRNQVNVIGSQKGTFVALSD